MLRITFLADLQERLYGMPQEEIEERLSFYNEMINDRMEEGLSEEEAIEAIGPVDEIAAQILSSIPAEPAPAPVPETAPVPDYAAYPEMPVNDVTAYNVPVYAEEPKKSVSGLKTALLLLGFPIWGSLLISAGAVVFSIIVTLLAVVVSFWAAAAGLAAGAVVCIPGAVGSFLAGKVLLGVAWIGAGLALAGFAILLFLCGGAVTSGLITVIKKIAGGFGKLFRRKGRKS